jgi:hypothetical protein
MSFVWHTTTTTIKQQDASKTQQQETTRTTTPTTVEVEEEEEEVEGRSLSKHAATAGATEEAAGENELNLDGEE